MPERNGIRVSFAFSFLSLFLVFSEIVGIWLRFFSLTVASYVASTRNYVALVLSRNI